MRICKFVHFVTNTSPFGGEISVLGALLPVLYLFVSSQARLREDTTSVTPA